MRTSIWALPILTAGYFTAGCDAQAGTDYRGEPLLSVTGSVAIETQDPPDDLIPALAFDTRKGERLLIEDVQVRGEFPARFSFDVFEPPPSEALIAPEDSVWLNEPTIARGYITAVRADHRGSIPATDRGDVSESCGPTDCTRISEWCPNDDGVCYRTVARCDSNLENCQVIEESGDPALAETRRRTIAGLSENYRVFYFANRVAKGTIAAHALNLPEGAAPGYYLFELKALTSEEQAENRACVEAARLEALKRLNAEHGTEYADWSEVPAEVGSSENAIRLAARDLGCIFGGARATLVSDPKHTLVRVTIGEDVVAIPFY